MHSVWTVHTLFTTVKFVPQNQQMRAKKLKKQKTWKWKRRRDMQTVTQQDKDPKQRHIQQLGTNKISTNTLKSP